MGYHEEKPLRERFADLFYKIPTLPRPLEHILIIYIKKIEGKNPRWKHLGTNCPCMKN